MTKGQKKYLKNTEIQRTKAQKYKLHNTEVQVNKSHLKIQEVPRGT